MLRRVMLIVGTVFVGGCNAPEAPRGDPLPAPPLVVVPEDLQTSLDGLVQFDIEASSEVVLERVLQRLTADLVVNNVTLGDLPPFTVTREARAGATPAGRLAVRPIGQPRGWFFVNMPALSDVSLTSSVPLPTETGSARVRFGVGVPPVLARVEVCSPPDAFPYVQLVFSEPVRLTESATLASTVEFRGEFGELLTCEEVAGGGPLEEGYAKRKWSFACSAPPLFHVALPPRRIESAETQMPLTHFADGRDEIFLEVDTRDLVQHSGCYVYAPW